MGIAEGSLKASVALGSLLRCLCWLLLSPGVGERRSMPCKGAQPMPPPRQGALSFLGPAALGTGSVSSPWPVTPSQEGQWEKGEGFQKPSLVK